MPEKITKKENKDYYLGLDIGTNSVGWAVTDTAYNVLKFKKKEMWGIRLFDEAITAEERRTFRTSRRRTQRKSERLKLLEMLFSEEIAKVDPSFFVRLHESNLYLEDKSANVPYSVFADANYTDKDYHRDFPTVYHLRKELIENSKPHDVRLVFLALHHIIKNRGHFLFDYPYDSKSSNDFNTVYKELKNYISECKENGEFDEIDLELNNEENIQNLKDKLTKSELSKTEKAKELAKIFGITEKENKAQYSILMLMCGCSVKLIDIFGDEFFDDKDTKDDKDPKKETISFAEKYEEKEEHYESLLGENFELIQKIKAVYDWALLTDILGDCEYLSEAKVAKYEKHKKDLRTLRNYVKKYIPEKKEEIFEKGGKEHNYVAYSKHNKNREVMGVLEKSCTQAEFCEYLKKVLGKDCLSGEEEYKKMFKRIADGSFMPKPVSKDNGVIPMQVNEKELVKILDNAKGYLPFLNDKDDKGISVYDKIIKIFEYRIPYFVGPLNKHSSKAWLVRGDEKIYPWNIEKVVDYDKSMEKFIENLTSKCTYLPDCDVIPKNSLLYSEFCVLNEINNITLDGKKIDVKTKQEIFENCFMKHYKVSKKHIEDFLESKGIEFEVMGGIDDKIKSSLKSYNDLKIYNLSYEEKEDIIKDITIFSDDKKGLKKRLKSKFGEKLSDNDINKIAKLKYKGWSNLSREFLTGITAVYKKTGEVLNIRKALWETNYNLMSVLYSKDFSCDGKEDITFDKKVREMNSFNANMSLDEIVEDLNVSPLVKRSIKQALLITKEVEKVMKCPPKKIFVEVPREKSDPKNKKRTVSRKKNLEKLYKSCEKEYKEIYDSLKGMDEDRLKSDKLYLYFTQLGRSMYTGKRIELDDLMDKNKWDIDHIYPQSKIMDDSLDNRVLVEKDVNSEKTNKYPLDAKTRENMQGFWKTLLDKGLISRNKYERLVRNTPLSEEELSAFISRQLVATRQSTKAVANILESLYPKPTEVVYVKAALVSEFRHEFDLLKCREVNDHHHAKDAYLNIVVGNVYNVRITHNKKNFIENLQKDDKNYTVKLESIFKHDVNGAWAAEGKEKSISTVKKVMKTDNILYTRYAFKQKGGLFKQNILKKGKGQVSIKENSPRSDISKYGGYNSAASAYFSLVKYKDGENTHIRLVPIDLYEESKYLVSPKEYVERYISEIESNKESKKFNGHAYEILIPCIKYGACLSVNGCRIHISNKSGEQIGCKPGYQLILGYENEKYIKGLIKGLGKDKKEDLFTDDLIKRYKISKEKNLELYDLLTDKLQLNIYNKLDKVMKDLQNGREKFIALDLKEQAFVITEILKMLKCNVDKANLTSIGGKGKAGSMSLGMKLTTKNNKTVQLIDQSVTGLFEKKTELLNL